MQCAGGAVPFVCFQRSGQLDFPHACPYDRLRIAPTPYSE